MHDFAGLKRTIALTLFLFSLSLTAGAQSESAKKSIPADLAAGIALHDAAHANLDWDTVNGAIRVLKPLVTTDPLAKAYYGSALSLRASLEARDKNAVAALAILNESATLIDGALASDPESVELRLLRMENSYGVSVESPVNRWPAMKEDLDWLNARRNGFTPETLGVIDLYAGLYFARSRDIDGALDAWDRCVSESPGSPEADEARLLLAKYGD